MAATWLRFLGILEDPPHSERNAFFSRDVDEFIAHLRDERGLSPNTVGSRRWQIEGFLDHVSSRKASIASITVADVDAFSNVCAQIDFETKARALARCEAAGTSAAHLRWRNQPAPMDFLRSL